MSSSSYGIEIDGTNEIIDIVNCVIYNYTSRCIFSDLVTTVNVYNCVLTGAGANGIDRDEGTAILKNYTVFNNIGGI